jgi:hypothetical protein
MDIRHIVTGRNLSGKSVIMRNTPIQSVLLAVFPEYAFQRTKKQNKKSLSGESKFFVLGRDICREHRRGTGQTQRNGHNQGPISLGKQSLRISMTGCQRRSVSLSSSKLPLFRGMGREFEFRVRRNSFLGPARRHGLPMSQAAHLKLKTIP